MFNPRSGRLHGAHISFTGGHAHMDFMEQPIAVGLARQPSFPEHLHIAVNAGRRR